MARRALTRLQLCAGCSTDAEEAAGARLGLQQALLRPLTLSSCLLLSLSPEQPHRPGRVLPGGERCAGPLLNRVQESRGCGARWPMGGAYRPLPAKRRPTARASLQPPGRASTVCMDCAPGRGVRVASGRRQRPSWRQPGSRRPGRPPAPSTPQRAPVQAGVGDEGTCWERCGGGLQCALRRRAAESCCDSHSAAGARTFTFDGRSDVQSSFK